MLVDEKCSAVEGLALQAYQIFKGRLFCLLLPLRSVCISGPLWYWSISPTHLRRALDLAQYLWGKNNKGKVFLGCERKENFYCVSSWPLRISVQMVPTSIFCCKKSESHIHPGFTHWLNLGLVGWTVALLFLEMEVHVSFTGSEPKLMDL